MKCIRVENPLSTFDKRSIRTLKRGGSRILIGCPKGKWQAHKQRCSVGTKAYEVITPGRCRRGRGRGKILAGRPQPRPLTGRPQPRPLAGRPQPRPESWKIVGYSTKKR